MPETGRVLVVTPATYALMKKSKDIVMETGVGDDLLDGMSAWMANSKRRPFVIA